MIPSVQERKRNLNIFMKAYPQLCRLHNVVPNACIKVDEANSVLEFPGERLKLDDWKPVLEAISNDRSLHYISIHNKYSKSKALSNIKKENKGKQTINTKMSPLLTKSIVDSLAVALSTCLSQSPALTGLLLENVNLSCDSLKKLIQGLEVSNNLQQLSLPYAQLGDEGCAALCRILRHRLNLVWINLTGCNLTHIGIGSLCKLLIFQKLNRYSESWKQSLRCRKVNPNIMPGLRRLTLSHNLIGDIGVKTLVETLNDDLWVKALDLQDCGISSVGGEDILNLLEENQFLSVVDIRGNKGLPSSLVATVIQTTFNRNNDADVGYPWLKLDGLTTTCRNNVPCNSRSMQKTNIGSVNNALSVLPKKVRVTIPDSYSSSSRCIRPSSSKSIQNQKPSTPKPPWNWNNKYHPLRREISNTLISAQKSKIKSTDSPELHSLKQQIQEMACDLEEEIRKRIKIEKELKEYKNIMDFTKHFKQEEEDNFKKIFYKLYNSYLSKSYNDKDTTSDNHIEKNSSLESVITTLNGDNAHIPMDLVNKTDVMNLKPHIIFETLLSS